MRSARRIGGAVRCLLVAIAGCTSSRPTPSPPPMSGDLVRRHYDQVCQIEPRDRPGIRVSEIFDTAGLVLDLVDVAARPVPVGSQSVAVRWPTLDFISRYGKDGRPGASGVWETTLDSVTALQVGRILEDRILALTGLLEPEGFRTVVTLSPRPTIEVESPVVCLPHVMHEPGKRPPGLPTDVTTWLESGSLRLPRGGSSGREIAALRIHLDREGEVTGLDSLAGDSLVLVAARQIVSQLRFDPALRNGEPVLGELVQSFGFRPGYRSGR